MWIFPNVAHKVRVSSIMRMLSTFAWIFVGIYGEMVTSLQLLVISIMLAYTKKLMPINEGRDMLGRLLINKWTYIVWKACNLGVLESFPFPVVRRLSNCQSWFILFVSILACTTKSYNVDTWKEIIASLPSKQWENPSCITSPMIEFYTTIMQARSPFPRFK